MINKTTCRIAKRPIAFFIFALLANVAPAQQTHVIEPAVMEVSYHVVMGESTDDYALRIGKQVSQFFSYNKLRSDSLGSNKETARIVLNELLEQVQKRHNHEAVKSVSSPGLMDFLYTNLCKDSISIYTQIMGDRFRIVEPIPAFDWAISEDSTRLIMGFNCHLATTSFRGRQWQVWYTEDIPLMLGPWKLGGLPGLILSADVEGFISYTAVGIKTEHVSPVTFYNWYNKKFETIDRKKYLRARNSPNAYPTRTRPVPPLELDWMEEDTVNTETK